MVYNTFDNQIDWSSCITNLDKLSLECYQFVGKLSLGS